MASVSDTQVQTLAGLGYTGSLADMQYAYLDSLTTAVGSVTDLQVAVGQTPSLLVVIEEPE